MIVAGDARPMNFVARMRFRHDSFNFSFDQSRLYPTIKIMMTVRSLYLADPHLHLVSQVLCYQQPKRFKCIIRNTSRTLSYTRLQYSTYTMFDTVE